ncbi:O-antigen polysaccharide polymerase Wzy [Thalassotalea castellviae]|uniref:O-antigen polysaccharide polymerase Wzy n=1 Tax=Thalassotalea castellviae TaxID=3075612 RepID=A0ABU3A1M5_9GAMM|nr:O-antigen polysaccharide polymerase Wzy [Thalassotalea sp. W431]MDT0604077.1 O-antigen polysaccharide polymerase Wzy [Thalassotalea sp. W431]
MPYTSERQSLLKVCSIIIIVMMTIILLTSFWQAIIFTREELELFSLFNWLILSALLAYALPKGIWSICFIFFSAFSIFHGGLVFVSAIGLITDKDILYSISFWFHRNETVYAIYLMNFTMLIYALTAISFSKKATATHDTLDLRLIKRFHHIGGALLLFMITTFLLVGFATGALQSYTAYLTVINQSPFVTLLFVYIYLFMGMAVVFVAVSYRPGFGYFYFLAFAIWAVIAFKVGLRGEVMFPTCVAAAILGRRKIPIGTFKLSIMIFIMLIAIVIVKNARLSGDYSKIDNMNPLNALAEMGSSLRTVQEVVKWRNEGFKLLYGASYWAPFERQLALFLPIERPPAKKDKRLLNVVVQEKAGPIGFSPVAEAYLNFGEKGIIFIAFILGISLAKFDSLASTVRADTLIGVALIPLFIMIRNSFTFIPVQTIMGIIIALIILQLAKIRVVN